MNLQLSGKNYTKIDIMLNCQEIQNVLKEFSLQGLEMSMVITVYVVVITHVKNSPFPPRELLLLKYRQDY